MATFSKNTCLHIQQSRARRNVSRDFKTTAGVYKWENLIIHTFTFSSQGVGTDQEIPPWFPWRWSASWHLPKTPAGKVRLPQVERMKQSTDNREEIGLVRFEMWWFMLSWVSHLWKSKNSMGKICIDIVELMMDQILNVITPKAFMFTSSYKLSIFRKTK